MASVLAEREERAGGAHARGGCRRKGAVGVQDFSKQGGQPLQKLLGQLPEVLHRFSPDFKVGGVIRLGCVVYVEQGRDNGAFLFVRREREGVQAGLQQVVRMTFARSEKLLQAGCPLGLPPRLVINDAGVLRSEDRQPVQPVDLTHELNVRHAPAEGNAERALRGFFQGQDAEGRLFAVAEKELAQVSRHDLFDKQIRLYLGFPAGAAYVLHDQRFPGFQLKVEEVLRDQTAVLF